MTVLLIASVVYLVTITFLVVTAFMVIKAVPNSKDKNCEPEEW